MVLKCDLTKEYVRECFDYNPETGILYWKRRPIEHFRTERGCRTFNTSRSGKPAGYKSKDGYLNLELDAIAYRLHILIWIWMNDEIPDEIDHINGIRDDNRYVNIRNVNRFENQRNAKRRKDNTSGVTGVIWHERLQKYEVSIYYKKNNMYLGVYADFDEAVAVRKAAEKEYGFHENHGRD